MYKNFSQVKYATKITFQQSTRPWGSKHGEQKWFSGKYHLHGKKLEVYVLSNKLDVIHSSPQSGSAAIIDIL